jgi:hypothetical protein
LPRNVKSILIRATEYIELPGEFDSSTGRRPNNDLFALSEPIVMRSVSIAGLLDTQLLAYGKIARLGVICLAIATCFGCGKNGPRRAAVSGHVTLDGQAIDQGVIQFLPVEGTVGPETGGVITKGQYAIPQQHGAVVGKSRVELRASKKTGRKIQDPTGRPGVLTDEYNEIFPPSSNTSSTLVREIKDDLNTLDFDIRTKSL